MNLLLQPDNDAPPSRKAAARWTSFALAALVLIGGIAWAFAALDYRWDWQAIWNYRQKLLLGWTTTVWLSAAALVCSLIIGLLAAFARRSRVLPLRYLATVYVELIRGTPLLVQILVFFYIFANAVGIDNRYLTGIAIMALFSGAYISEIIRSGIESVGRSQLLAAKAVGFSRYQTFRYVVFPQALRRSLPALAGQLANLIKDSSLLSIIAISEFTLNVQEANALTYSAFEGYLPLAVGYLVLSLPIMRLSRRLENRLAFET